MNRPKPNIRFRDSNNTIDYNYDFFTPISVEHAKEIVLGHGIYNTNNRWNIETEWTKRLFKTQNFLNENSIVLDWGCGIGRLSKMMIETFNCQVVGVDINQPMLNFAKEYVNDVRFTTLLLKDFESNTIKFTNAISVWTLQHSDAIDYDLHLIKRSLEKEASIFIFEMLEPSIPLKGNSQGTWGIIPVSNQAIIKKYFSEIKQGKFPKILGIKENDDSWYAFYKNNKAV